MPVHHWQGGADYAWLEKYGVQGRFSVLENIRERIAQHLRADLPLDPSEVRNSSTVHLTERLDAMEGQLHFVRENMDLSDPNLTFFLSIQCCMGLAAILPFAINYLDHHTLYDSKTSQHKNYTIHEVKAARDRLFEAIAQKRHLGEAQETDSGWEVRYPGGLVDVSMLRVTRINTLSGLQSLRMSRWSIDLRTK
jgi:hypothetical protein